MSYRPNIATATLLEFWQCPPALGPESNSSCLSHERSCGRYLGRGTALLSSGVNTPAWHSQSCAWDRYRVHFYIYSWRPALGVGELYQQSAAFRPRRRHATGLWPRVRLLRVTPKFVCFRRVLWTAVAPLHVKGASVYCTTLPAAERWFRELRAATSAGSSVVFSAWRLLSITCVNFSSV